MPTRQRLPGSAVTAPYLSRACRIGTHFECEEAEPKAAPIGVPILYEACTCPCHPVAPNTSGEGNSSG